MAIQVVMGATLQCQFSLTPSALIVTPDGPPVTAGGPKLAANIADHKPLVNIPSFGMCMAPTNPVVIAATAAAGGVPTPAPCVPATPSPWVPGSPTVHINNILALNNTSKCMCTWAGVISVLNPGQMTVYIP